MKKHVDLIKGLGVNRVTLWRWKKKAPNHVLALINKPEIRKLLTEFLKG